jgi:hypothetical protein
VKAAGLALALFFGVAGFLVAFGAWSVGYCGALTGDVPSPGTLRHDLCRGATGDVTSGAVLVAWLVAAIAPLVGMRISLARGSSRPLVVASVLGAVPLLAVLVLAEVLPQT